jgi:hypothetical protein
MKDFNLQKDLVALAGIDSLKLPWAQRMINFLVALNDIMKGGRL